MQANRYELHNNIYRFLCKVDSRYAYQTRIMSEKFSVFTTFYPGACAKLLRTGDVNKVIVIVFEQLSISRLKISDTRDGCLSVGVIWPGHSTAATPAPHVPARAGPGPMGPERDTASRAAAVSVTIRARNEPSQSLKVLRHYANQSRI